MKKNIKIFLVLTLSISILSIVLTNVYAASHVIERVESHATTSAMEVEEIETTAGEVINIMQTVGIIVGVIVLAILGIKFMMGSAEEKAEYKKSFIPFIIGAFILMSAFPIAKFLFSIFGD